jgi:hypothetical protein
MGDIDNIVIEKIEYLLQELQRKNEAHITNILKGYGNDIVWKIRNTLNHLCSGAEEWGRNVHGNKNTKCILYELVLDECYRRAPQGGKQTYRAKRKSSKKHKRAVRTRKNTRAFY